MAVIAEAYSKVLKGQGEVKEAEELHVKANRARTTAGLVVSANSLVQ
jgi:hypothetical protein